jgi:hypothetical protein
MKKFWKIIGVLLLILFVLIVVALIGGYFFLKNFDIAKYKPQIITMASQSLGRTVDFKDVDLKVSLKDGVRFNVSDFVIGENPDFGSGAFISVGEIDAGLDILSFVITRQISIPNILIRSPRIRIIRNSEGILNAQTIAKPPDQQPEEKVKAAALPLIFINAFKITDAEFNFTDQSMTPGQNIAMTQFNLEVRNFSLTHSFDVVMDAAVLSVQKNLHVNGKVQLALAKNEIKLADVDVAVDLNQLTLDQLKGLSLLKGVPIPEVLKGQLKVKIKESVLSDKGLNTLVLDASFNDGQIVAVDIVPGISVQAKRIDLAVNNFSLKGNAPFHVSLTAAFYQEEPNVNFKSDAVFDVNTMGIHLTQGKFSTDFALWPLEKIKEAVAPLQSVPLPQHLAGTLQATIKDAKVSAEGLDALMLDARLSGGEIAVDNIIPGASIVLNRLDLAVRDFALDQPFFVSLRTAYLSEDQDISFEGNISLDLKNQAAKLNNVVFGFDCDKFSLERFKASGLIPEGVPFPQVLGGKIETRINDLALSSKGVERLKADIDWHNGKIAMTEVAPGISVAGNSIDLNVKNFSFKDVFDIAATLGYESDVQNISLSGQAAFDPVTQYVRLSQMTIKTDLSKIPLDRLKTTLAPLQAVPLPEMLTGLLEATIKELTAGPKGLGVITADVALKDGSIRMKDVSPGVSFAASHVNIGIHDFGLGTSFGFNIEMAYLHDLVNIQTQGTAKLYMEDQSIQLKDATAETDLSTLSLDQLKSSIAALKDASLPERLQGKFNIIITDAVAGAKGLSRLTGRGVLTGGEIKLKEFALPIQGVDTKFQLTEKDFMMDSIQARLGKGQVTAQAGVKDYLARQDFTLSAELKGIDLAEILDQKQAQVKVEGLVTGFVKAQGQGSDIYSMTGEGNLEVKEAKLKDLNILKTILDKISFLPNVSSRVEAGLTEKYKQKLNNKDTEINKVSAAIVISNGAAVVDPISIEADEFVFSGKSRAGFDAGYSLNGSVKIPAELSSAMAQGVSEMKYLYDENSNISIPVHVVGKGAQPPSFSVTQTALDMSKNILRNEGKKQLGNIFDKVLGIEGKASSSDVQGKETEGVDQKETSPAAEIIDGIFNNIFK